MIARSIFATLVALGSGSVIASIAGSLMQRVAPADEGARESWALVELAADFVANGYWVLLGALLFYSLPVLAYMLGFEIAAVRYPRLRSKPMLAAAVIVGSAWVLLVVRLIVGGGKWDQRTAVAVLGTVFGIGSGLALISKALTKKERVQAG